jgi:ATP-dependent transcriptional regulator
MKGTMIMLQSKVCMPSIGKNTVSRKKMEDKLNRLPENRLVYISAPAGYGKTTAVAEYLSRKRIKYAWFSIDQEDNDPVRFWRYFLYSLAQCMNREEIGQTSLDLELITSNMTGDLLINSIEAAGEEYLIVFDDYHLIENRIILNSMGHFVKYMPNNASILILSRKEPEYGLTVQRSGDRTVTIGAKDLCFDLSEIAEFFSRLGFSLTDEDVNSIKRSTEGWVAGLVAASFSMREHDDINEVVSSFSGKNKNINLILEHEIFNNWPDEVQRFLIDTSFLNKLSGSLCYAVTGNINSEKLLVLLSETNSFIFPLDMENKWFRYHHLFQEFLVNRLEKEDESARRHLYMLAGEWYLKNGFSVEGINCLLKAEDYEKALPYILNYRFETIILDFEFIQWINWIDCIPESLYKDDITVYTSYSWVASMDDKPELAKLWADKARAGFERLKDGFKEEDRNKMEAYLLSCEINVAISRMDEIQSLLLFSKLIRLNIQEPVRLGQMNWNEPCLLKTNYGFRGRLEKVKNYLPVLNRLPGLFGDLSSYITVIIAEVYYEQNNIKELNTMLIGSMGIITEMKNPGILVPGFITMAKGRMAMGDISGAFQTLEEAKKLLDGKSKEIWNYHLDIIEAKLFLLIGDSSSATKLYHAEKINIYDNLSCIREMEYIVYARYLMLTNHLEDAQILLNRLMNYAQKENRLGSQIEILALTAICQSRTGNLTSALSTLEQAFILGETENYIRSFVDELEPMAVLLERYISVRRNSNKDKHLTYARRLFRDTNEYIRIIRSTGKIAISFGQSKTDFSRSFLSRREVEILKLLVKKCSNEEIAQELFVSISAIKQHNSRIFDKLGVRNRHEAIARAREIGIIE